LNQTNPINTTPFYLSKIIFHAVLKALFASLLKIKKENRVFVNGELIC
jgi:hypothetical protein